MWLIQNINNKKNKNNKSVEAFGLHIGIKKKYPQLNTWWILKVKTIGFVNSVGPMYNDLDYDEDPHRHCL